MIGLNFDVHFISDGRHYIMSYRDYTVVTLFTIGRRIAGFHKRVGMEQLTILDEGR